MDAELGQSTTVHAPHANRRVIYAATLLLVIVGALLVYKGTAALAVIGKVENTGSFQPRNNVVPIPGSSAQVNFVARSINYFAVIWPALLLAS